MGLFVWSTFLSPAERALARRGGQAMRAVTMQFSRHVRRRIVSRARRLGDKTQDLQESSNTFCVSCTLLLADSDFADTTPLQSSF